MKIGPKYKIARRLGAPIFEKTQSPKYALSLARKERSGGSDRRSKPKSEFGRALIEKQKARFTYGLSEKQFRGYVDKALSAQDPVQKLFSLLETRLDNVLFRAGFAKTRSQARQTSGHGHLMIDGVRVTVPSILLKKGNVVSIRPSSASSPLFGEVAERMKSLTPPVWLKVNPENISVTVEGVPVYAPQEHLFDLGVVIEFYNR